MVGYGVGYGVLYGVFMFHVEHYTDCNIGGDALTL